jgi:hypothetical protein
MANQTITQLTDATALAGTELVPIVQNGGTVKTTVSAIAATSTSSFSAGTTGLTPSTPTSGAVVLAGTLITSNGGTGLSSYTAGDTLYYASGTALSKLAIGAASRIMTSSGSAPQWTDPATITVGTATSATTATNIAGGTANQILFQSGAGSTTFVTAPTVTDTFLKWNGSAFVWVAVSSGGVTSVTATSPLASSGGTTPDISLGTVTTANGGTGITTYTAGDLLYYATGTALSKLGIGASTYILTSSGTAPQYTDPATITVGTATTATTATNVTGGAAGSLVYQTASATTSTLALGTQGYVLRAGASAPEWAVIDGGTF